MGNKHDCTQVQAHRQQVHALHMSRAYTVCISHVLMHDIIMYINLRIPICTLQLALCIITSYNILTQTVRSGRTRDAVDSELQLLSLSFGCDATSTYTVKFQWYVVYIV